MTAPMDPPVLLVFRLALHDENGCAHDTVTLTPKSGGDDYDGVCAHCELPVRITDRLSLRHFYRRVHPRHNVVERCWEPRCPRCQHPMEVWAAKGHRNALVCANPDTDDDDCPPIEADGGVDGLWSAHALTMCGAS